MKVIEPAIQLRSGTGAGFSPKGSRVTVVVLALAALSGLVYYLLRKYPSLSPGAQRIFDSIKYPPRSLRKADLHRLAKEVESIQLKSKPTFLERYKLKFPFFFFWKKKFIVEVRQNTWRLQYIETTLGRGGFGKVVRLFDLHNGQRTALKVATPPKTYNHDQDYFAKACQDLKKEHQNLTLVHEGSRTPPVGVQDNPLSDVLTIIKRYRPTQKHIAYEGTLYDGSLDKLDLKKYSIKTRLGVALQVLQGMKTLLSKKLICHDLKFENILYRLNQDQKSAVVHISDLGGATQEDNLSKELKSGLAHTSAYADDNQLALAQIPVFGFAQRKCVRNSEKCSLGLTIFSIVTAQNATIESLLKNIWRKAGLPLEGDYGNLFLALEKYSRPGLLNSLFKTNTAGLRKIVQTMYEKCNQ